MNHRELFEVNATGLQVTVNSYPVLARHSLLLKVGGWLILLASSIAAFEDPHLLYGTIAGAVALIAAELGQTGIISFDGRSRVVHVPKQFSAPARDVPFDDILCVLASSSFVHSSSHGRGRRRRNFSLALVRRDTEPLLRGAVEEARAYLGSGANFVSNAHLTYAVEQFLFDGKRGRIHLLTFTRGHEVVALAQGLSKLVDAPLLDACNDPPRLLSQPIVTRDGRAPEPPQGTSRSLSSGSSVLSWQHSRLMWLVPFVLFMLLLCGAAISSNRPSFAFIVVALVLLAGPDPAESPFIGHGRNTITLDGKSLVAHLRWWPRPVRIPLSDVLAVHVPKGDGLLIILSRSGTTRLPATQAIATWLQHEIERSVAASRAAEQVKS